MADDSVLQSILTANLADSRLSFLESYWLHPFWKNISDPWIRFRLLPSVWARKNRKLSGQLFKKEGAVYRSNIEEIIQRVLIPHNQRGYDIFYFINVLPYEIKKKFAEDEDVEQVLFLPHDLDIKLPEPVDSIYSDLGIHPNLIIESSRRNETPNYQSLLAIDVEDGGRDKDEERAVVVHKYLTAVGSDPTCKNKSRIFRFPGFINFGKPKAEEISPATLSFVQINIGKAKGDERLHTRSIQEIDEYVDRFHDSDLSEKLRKIRFDSIVVRGGSKSVNPATGHYGNWEDAYDAAVGGEATIGEGGRHPALISWAGQMAKGGLHPSRMISNIRFLAEKACNPGYGLDRSEVRDLNLIITSALKYLEIEQVQIDELFKEAAEEVTDDLAGGVGEEIDRIELPDAAIGSLASRLDDAVKVEVAGTEVTKCEAEVWREKLESVFGSSLPPMPSTESGVFIASPPEPTPTGGTVGAAGPNDVLSSGDRAPPKAVRVTPSLPPDGGSAVSPRKRIFGETFVPFAHCLASKLENEDSGDYLDWLGLVVVSARFAEKKHGNFEPLARAIYDRLTKVRAVRSKQIVFPYEIIKKGRSFISIAVLGEKEQEAFMYEMLCSISAQIRKNAKELTKRSVVDEEKKKNKNFTLHIAIKGTFLNDTLRALRGRILDKSRGVDQPDNVIVFQNGFYVLGGAAEDSQTGEKYCRGFHPDDACAWYDRARWRFLHPVAAYYTETSALVQTGEHFQTFLSDCFPGDEDKLTREVLVPRIIGYCLLAANPLQQFFIFMGSSGAGKGTFCELILELCGAENTARVQFLTLTKEWAFGALSGKMVGWIDEAESSDKKVYEDALSNIKRYAGSSMIASRRMRENETTVAARAKLLLSFNREFQANDYGGALERRVVPIKFGNPRAKGEKIVGLAQKIYAVEGDLIASWAAAALDESWSRNDALFTVGGLSYVAGRESMEQSSNPITYFCRSVMIGEPNSLISSIAARELFLMAQQALRLRIPGGRLDINVAQAMQSIGIKTARTSTCRGFAAKASMLAFQELTNMSQRDICRALDQCSEIAKNEIAKLWRLDVAGLIVGLFDDLDPGPESSSN